MSLIFNFYYLQPISWFKFVHFSNLDTHNWQRAPAHHCASKPMCETFVVHVQAHSCTRKSDTNTPLRRNRSSNKCPFNRHTPEFWQSVYAYEDSNTCTHLHTGEAYNHIDCPGHTRVRITPDSGLRELIKRKNPDDISSPLESTRNDNRIGLPMEMSLV